MDGTALTITDEPGAQRFEARRDGELVGFIDYRRVRDRLILVHTEVLPIFEGQGIATTMARHVLGGARSRQDRVSIKCPYLRDFVERHPEFAPGPDGRIPPAG